MNETTQDQLTRTPRCAKCGAYYQPPVQSDSCPHDGPEHRLAPDPLVAGVADVMTDSTDYGVADPVEEWRRAELEIERLRAEIEQLRARVAELERDLEEGAAHEP